MRQFGKGVYQEQKKISLSSRQRGEPERIINKGG